MPEKGKWTYRSRRKSCRKEWSTWRSDRPLTWWHSARPTGSVARCSTAFCTSRTLSPAHSLPMCTRCYKQHKHGFRSKFKRPRNLKGLRNVLPAEFSDHFQKGPQMHNWEAKTLQEAFQFFAKNEAYNSQLRMCNCVRVWCIHIECSSSVNWKNSKKPLIYTSVKCGWKNTNRKHWQFTVKSAFQKRNKENKDCRSMLTKPSSVRSAGTDKWEAPEQQHRIPNTDPIVAPRDPSAAVAKLSTHLAHLTPMQTHAKSKLLSVSTLNFKLHFPST